MANKAISELPQALNVNNQDLFVLEQSGIAKKLPAETFITEQGIINALAEALDGHGGIQSVTLSSVSGRIRTYRITFTDQSATTFQVYDGTSIDRISRTSSSGLDDVYTIFLSDGTTTFFTVHNGADGNVSEATLNSELAKKAPVITETVSSTAIATFADGADDMPLHNILAEINPVQDLNGYDNPWPAGSGENLLDVQTGISEQFSRSGETFTNTATDTRTAFSLAVQAYNGSTLIASNSTSPSGSYPSRTYVDITISSTPTLIRVKHNGSTRDLKIDFSFTKTGTFRFSCLIQNSDPTTVGGIVLKELMIAENNYYTPYVPYSNICPITGWTGVNVTRTGVNIWDEEWENGYIDASGALMTYESAIRSKNYCACKPNTTYYLKRPAGMTGHGVAWYTADKQFINRITNTTIMTAPNDAYFFKVSLYNYKSDGRTEYLHDVSLNYPSTDASYHSGHVLSLLISWQTEAGTVYGGTVDVATGLLTVTHGLVDMGAINYSRNPSYGFYFNLSNLPSAKAHTASEVANAWCSSYGITAYANVVTGNYNGFIGLATSTGAVGNTQYTDPNEFKTAMSGVQLVYELATPQTYQLTPQQLMTILGTNNVWADTGNVSVTYPADTKMYIENLTQPTEDDLVANQAITSGKYFMIGNSLYLALANIASGAQITIGTNAQRVSLADALNTINS